MSATWVISSYGMPRISAASRSCIRWNVVQTVPSPRARAASMNDHAAGMVEPLADGPCGRLQLVWCRLELHPDDLRMRGVAMASVGIEPPHAGLKGAALSAALRGLALTG